MAKRFSLPDAELKLLKDKVRTRDGNKCRVCSSRSGISCHHIQFRSDQGPDTDSNLVCLCSGCHDCVHGKNLKKFIVIVSPHGDDVLPDANYPLKFKKYNKVRRRVTWRHLLQ